MGGGCYLPVIQMGLTDLAAYPPPPLRYSLAKLYCSYSGRTVSLVLENLTG
jgi:hypothetical protein